jgi:hypothetical protein
MTQIQNGPAAHETSGEAGNQNYNADSKIIHLLPKEITRRPCRSCGVPFIPAQIHHRLCRDCWSWARVGCNLAENAKLMREVTR